jgi:hypothetical protein
MDEPEGRQSAEASRLPQVFRASYGLIVLGLLFFIAPAIGVAWIGFGGPHSTSDGFVIVAAASAYGFLGLICICWPAANFVCADSKGLRWRRWWKSGSADWADITDYYTRYREGINAKGEDMCIVTAHKVYSIADATGSAKGNSTLPRSSQLQRIVEERATASETRNWGVYGARTSDWPKRFSYGPHDPASRSRFLLNAGAGLVIAGVTVWCVVRVWPSVLPLGWPLALATSVLTWIFVALYPAIWLAVRTDPRDWSTFAGQTVDVCPESITLTTPQEVTSIRWSSVLNHCVSSSVALSRGQSIRYQVSSGSDTVVFSPCIEERRVLCRIVEIMSVNAKTPKWRPADSSTLRLERKTSLGGGSAVAERYVFTYQNRTNGALLSWPTALFLMPAIGSVARFLFGVSGPSIRDGMFLSASLELAPIVGWAAFVRSQVVIDESGISSKSLWRTQRIEWSEILALQYRKNDMLGGLTIRGPYSRIWISVFLADFDFLRAEVERRVGALGGPPSDGIP